VGRRQQCLPTANTKANNGNDDMTPFRADRLIGETKIVTYVDAADLWTGPLVFGFVAVSTLISGAARNGWRLLRRQGTAPPSRIKLSEDFRHGNAEF
jgi:hypothetical protein